MYDCTGRLISEKKKKISNVQACSEQVTKLRCVICYWDRLDALPRHRKFPWGPFIPFLIVVDLNLFCRRTRAITKHSSQASLLMLPGWSVETGGCGAGAGAGAGLVQPGIYPPRLPLTQKWFVILGDRESLRLFPLWGWYVHAFSLYSLSLPVHPGGIMDFSIYSIKT